MPTIDCDGVGKSVKFELSAEPFNIELKRNDNMLLLSLRIKNDGISTCFVFFD
jgi:hypothetical protein